MTPQAKTLRRPRTAALRRRETESLSPIGNLPPVLLSLPSLRGKLPAEESIATQNVSSEAVATPAKEATTTVSEVAATIPTSLAPEVASTPAESSTSPRSEIAAALAEPNDRAARRKTLTSSEGNTQPWWNIAIGVACMIAALAGAQIFLRGNNTHTANPTGAKQLSTDSQTEPHVPVIEQPVADPPPLAERKEPDARDFFPKPAPVEPKLPENPEPIVGIEPPASPSASGYPTTATPEGPRTAERPTGQATYPRTAMRPFDMIVPRQPESNGSGGAYPTTDPSTYLYRPEGATRPAVPNYQGTDRRFAPAPTSNDSSDAAHASLGAIDTTTVR